MVGQIRTLCAAAAVVLTGCGTNPPPAQSIDISDDNAFQPVLRASVGLSRLRGPASDPQTGHAFELGGTRAKGGSEQSLGGGSYASLGGSTFNGPTRLQSEFELRQFEILYRFRAIDSESGAGFELLAGPAWHQIDVAVQSAGRRATEYLGSAGPQLGLGGLWRIRRGTSVHLRGVYFYSADDVGVTRASRVEAYFSQALARNILVRAGYAGWSLDSDRGEAQSPINVRFRGPTLGLELAF